MGRRRKITSASFAVLVGATVFATTGTAAPDDAPANETVLRVVTVQSIDCPRHDGGERKAAL